MGEYHMITELVCMLIKLMLTTNVVMLKNDR